MGSVKNTSSIIGQLEADIILLFVWPVPGLWWFMSDPDLVYFVIYVAFR